MLRIAQYCLLIACLLLAGTTAALADENPVILQIHESPEAYSLTVPVSKLTMTLPKGSFSLKAQSLAGTPDNPRYFFFTDTGSGIVVSGWFESEDGFAGVAKFWAAETASWKKNSLPEPHDVAFITTSKWDAILYDLKIGSGTSSNVRAHWIQGGTWIDIHLSMTSERPAAESRAVLQSLLNSISVTVKK